jgi:hypothetical protein
VPTPIQIVLKTPPNQLKTVQVESKTHSLPTVTLAAVAVPAPVPTVAAPNPPLPLGVTVQAVTPMLSQGPAQVAPAGSYTSMTIINPTDGKLVYVGQDGTVNSQLGHALYPGNSLTLSSYGGAIWTLSSNGAAPLFFQPI